MMECYHSNKQDYVLINEGAKGTGFLEMLKQHAPQAYEVLTSFKGLSPGGYKSVLVGSRLCRGLLVMTAKMISTGLNNTGIAKKICNLYGLAYQEVRRSEKSRSTGRRTEIELELEKVRARAMAMQKTSELLEQRVL